MYYTRIPRRFMLSIGVSQEMCIVITQLIDLYMLGKNASLEYRVTCLNAMYICMQDTIATQNFFVRIIRNKCETQKAIKSILQDTVDIKNSSNEQQKNRHIQARLLRIQQLYKQFVYDKDECSSNDYVELMNNIFNTKDKNILKYINLLCDPLTSYTLIRSASTELIKAIRVQSGSSTSKNHDKLNKDNNNNITVKLTADKLVSRMIISLSMSIFPIDAIQYQFSYLHEQLNNNRNKTTVAALEFMLQMSLVYPQLYHNSYDELYNLIKRHDITSDTALQILSQLTPSQNKDQLPNNIQQSLLNELLYYVNKGSVLQTKYAVRCIYTLYSYLKNSDNTSDQATDIIQEITTSFINDLRIDNGDRLASIFSGLGM